ncbi:ORF6N domain-containing protein, partial [Poseidonibacter sp.]|uniref:ORF6N domain-containing protein n=1 Tax=Poseidonibacter sp. TaxID=2321188 RepID=UPI003C73CB6E
MHKLLINEETIKSKIFTVRGLPVMLDRDLAENFGVKAIRLREQVKRNIDRFPEDFMFQLTESEVEFMVSQNAIPSKQHLGGSLPLVFTEQGVSSLSSVLKSKVAVEVHINIIRAFVNMRKFISNNALIFQRLDNIETLRIKEKQESDEKFNKIFDALEDKSLKPKQGIFFDGQVYDAYVFVIDLIKSAKQSISLIDNYIDESVLTMLSKRDESVSATIFTKNISKQVKLDIEKYNKQYPNREIKKFDSSHDRFLILDTKKVYHI